MWRLALLGAARFVRLGRPTPIPTEALLQLKYEHPWDHERAKGAGPMRFIEGAHVTADSGTGIVHTAPAHGLEDFVACEKNGKCLLKPKACI